MTAIREQSFHADGPTTIGFESEGNIPIGVGVTSSKCGVYGETNSVARGRDTAQTDTGVHGRGGRAGVYGEGKPVDPSNPVITPRHIARDTAGIIGEGYSGSCGAVGLSFSGEGRNIPGPRAGVLGASNAYSEGEGFPTTDINDPFRRVKGAGVVGLNIVSGLDDRDLLILPDPGTRGHTFGDGTGVWGVSGAGIGVHGESNGTGVLGESGGSSGVGVSGKNRSGGTGVFGEETANNTLDGMGVFGRSNLGRGGVFESKKSAQLQLVPATKPVRETVTERIPLTKNFPALPFDGKAGDLIATFDEGDENRDAKLWFCIRGVVRSGVLDVPDAAARWAQVELGPWFEGVKRTL